MIVINQDEYNIKKQEILLKIKEGAVFIYPTDTIYGIGASALAIDSVKKIRKLKDRNKRPFSIIAPCKDWILENCHLNKDSKEWLNKLPGPYTLLLKLKNKEAVDGAVNAKLDTIGVRIPNHWISELVNDLDCPIVTTSANISTEEFMTSIDDLDVKIKNNVDFIIDEGEIKGRPSTIVDLTQDEIKIKKR